MRSVGTIITFGVYDTTHPLGSLMSVTLAPVANVETENPFAFAKVIAIVACSMQKAWLVMNAYVIVIIE